MTVHELKYTVLILLRNIEENEDEDITPSSQINTAETQLEIPIPHPSTSSEKYFVPIPPQQNPPSHFLKDKVPPITQKLNREEDNTQHHEQLNIAKSAKVICSLDLLLQLFQDKCRHPSCNQRASVDYTLIGTTVSISWSCTDGHCGKFYSSYQCNGVMATNLQAAAAIVYSGNNFYKINRFCQFLGLSFMSKSTFFRYQRLYCLPVISEWWEWQQKTIMEELKGSELVVSGDGQCDSPGHSAKNLCYFLMDTQTNFIIDVEVLDKRHTGLKSTNMERDALRNILNRSKKNLNVVEIVTDASSSIIKMIGIFI